MKSVILSLLLLAGSAWPAQRSTWPAERVAAEATVERLAQRVGRLRGELLRIGEDLDQVRDQLRALRERLADLSDVGDPGERPPRDDPGDDPGPPQLEGWDPPRVGLEAVPLAPNPAQLKTTWAGVRVEITPQTPDVFLEGGTVSKISASGPWGAAVFRDVTVRNELQSTFAVGVADRSPADIEDWETWATSPRATPYGGWLVFEDCHFGPLEGAESWAGYGGKMWLHPQAPASLYMRGCTLDPVREHGVYTEWFRHLHIEDCLFGDTGGNGIQSASRGGHGVLGNYLHGNPLNAPAGLGGWALIRDVVIEETYHGFRDASDVTFAGFLGPIVIDGLRCENTISAIAIHTDAFKGAWLANGDTVPWTEPVLYRSAVDGPPPEGLFSCPEVWIDRLEVTWDAANGRRGMVLLSGIQEVHFGVFRIEGNMPAIILNNEYGGPFPCGTAFFHDRASVEAHAGRIGWWDPQGGPSREGGFRAFTAAQLEDLVITQEEMTR